MAALLHRGASTTAPDEQAVTPALLAAQSHRQDLLASLLEARRKAVGSVGGAGAGAASASASPSASASGAASGAACPRRGSSVCVADLPGAS